MRAEQELLSRAALTAFRLNGQFLALAEELARPAGCTAARWQVLGAVLTEPLTVSAIARAMGITRQSVQRLADVLVGEGLAEYVDNPAHARAKLLRATDTGYAVIARIDPAHAAAAHRLTAELGRAALHDTVEAMSELSAALERLVPSRREFQRLADRQVGETPKRSGGGELGRRGEQLDCEPSPSVRGSAS